MQVRVLYFAMVRERMGASEQTIVLPANATVATLLDQLAATYDAVATLRGHLRVAVNEEFRELSHPLGNGDVVALIPPVSGGSGRYIRLLDTPLSVQRCIDQVAHVGAGGIATFIGNVRGVSHGKRVAHLEYEAYGTMAVATMHAIALEIETELPGTRVAVEHRTGRLELGDAAVTIAASAPHRAEAFAACQAMIDRLKERVPIWKKEFAEDGEVWVGLGP
ncbi:MAG: molybdopterin converting factor subunit 1 [Kofleriaceae bacterium]|nr:molybdopterin converting factor subunit 1 [Kofleriaceae bacterium]